MEPFPRGLTCFGSGLSKSNSDWRPNAGEEFYYWRDGEFGDFCFSLFFRLALLSALLSSASLCSFNRLNLYSTMGIFFGTRDIF